MSVVVRDKQSFSQSLKESSALEEIKVPHKNTLNDTTIINRESSMSRTPRSAVKTKCEAIPCVYLPYALGSSKILVYFHGNAEDIGLATELLDYMRTLLRVRSIGFLINSRCIFWQWNTLAMAYMMDPLRLLRF